MAEHCPHNGLAGANELLQRLQALKNGTISDAAHLAHPFASRLHMLNAVVTCTFKTWHRIPCLCAGGATQSPPNLLQGKKTLEAASNGMLSAQQGVPEEESALPGNDGLCYSRLSEETQDCSHGEAVSAPGAIEMHSAIQGQGPAADDGLGTLQQDDLSDQSAVQEEQEDLLLSYENEYNPSGSASSADLLLA